MRQAVIFDLYETLITENHPEWHNDSSSPAGVLGIDEQVFGAAWTRAYTLRMTGHFPDYATALRAICTELGIQTTGAAIEQLQQARTVAKARPFVRMEEDILMMLDTLRERGWTIGVITNCTFDEVAAWETSPLAERVDCPIYSCAVGQIKPDSAIYRLACSRLEVDPAQAVFVGDGGSDELRGAQAAGLKAIWATWFIERWPWDWVDKVSATSKGFLRCRSPLALPKLAADLLAAR